MATTRNPPARVRNRWPLPGPIILPARTLTAGLTTFSSVPGWPANGTEARLTCWPHRIGASHPITGQSWRASGTRTDSGSLWRRRWLDDLFAFFRDDRCNGLQAIAFSEINQLDPL